MDILDKIYIGDGIYMEDKGFEICLTTEDGVSALNTIVIEPDMWMYMVDYMKKVRENREHQADFTLTPGGL